jgi:taurine dioxygenase
MCIRMGHSHSMRDNIGTAHNAVAYYMPDKPRYMRRVQVMATLDYSALVA